MSENKIVNAIIALIEDRPDEAKEMLRSPEMRVSSQDVQMRLASALDYRESKAIVEALKNILRVSVRIDARETAEHAGMKKWNASHDEAFLLGVSTVEGLIEGRIEGEMAGC